MIDVPTDVKGLPEISNDKFCSFYIDDSLYILKPLILNSDNYNATYLGQKIEFNICNAMNIDN